MAYISRAALFSKLNSKCFSIMESATFFCKLRKHDEVDIVHFLHQVFKQGGTDVQCICEYFNVVISTVEQDIIDYLEGLPAGVRRSLDFSLLLEEVVERGWTYCTLCFGRLRIRSADLLIGILSTRHIRHGLIQISKEFAKIRVDQLVDSFATIIAESPESRLDGSPNSAFDGNGQDTPSADASSALALYTVDVTAQAEKNALDPVIGRDSQIRQLVDILLRRRQNNPLLVGEAGVGKTAVVEGFAQQIVKGDVPPLLKHAVVRSLDIGLLLAGARVKGEFEHRLRAVIDAVDASVRPIILFIDEAHMLVGSGGQSGVGDAANILKPALARGSLRTIGATTWAEYKQYFEQDAALVRRFQPVWVDAPDTTTSVYMLRSVVPAMEKHHKVLILDDALAAAVHLSDRYIPARQLPDKAISVLDTACARVASSQHAVPAKVEDARNIIARLETQLGMLQRQKMMGMDIADRDKVLLQSLAEHQETKIAVEARWQQERNLVEKIVATRNQLSCTEECSQSRNGTEVPVGAKDIDHIQHSENDCPHVYRDLAHLEEQLKSIQNENPSVFFVVDEQAVAAVVADWTGIPVGRMLRSELDISLSLSRRLQERVLGQDYALDCISRRVLTARSGLQDPNKPIGVFLLAGSSGVGKTETALAVAEILYGGEQNVITINMSEFQEAHSVSTLKGAPPGYVGYGKGGVLTEAVRRRPYSVILFDEVEKAHKDVHELFYQIFDKGVMEDSEGRRIDFKNTLIFLTTNCGSETILRMCAGVTEVFDTREVENAVRSRLLEVFPAALLGRLVTIIYYPLSLQIIQIMVGMKIDKILQRIMAVYGIVTEYDPSICTKIAERCIEMESGGRMIDYFLTQTLLPEVSHLLLNAKKDDTPVEYLHISLSEAGFEYYLRYKEKNAYHDAVSLA